MDLFHWIFLKLFQISHRHPVHSFKAHQGAIYSLLFIEAPEIVLVTGGSNADIHIWDWAQIVKSIETGSFSNHELPAILNGISRATNPL